MHHIFTVHSSVDGQLSWLCFPGVVDVQQYVDGSTGLSVEDYSVLWGKA